MQILSITLSLYLSILRHCKNFFRRQHPLDMFFHHHMKICAAESVRAHADASRQVAAFRHFARVGGKRKRGAFKRNIRIGNFRVQCRRNDFVMNRKRCFEQARRARARFQMSDVGFHRTQRDGIFLRAAKNFRERIDFDHIADARARAVRFDHHRACRVNARVFPRALCGQFLSDGIRRGDAFALAVTRAADAAHDRVNFVAAAFRVFETFNQKCRAAFAHHKTVRAFAERARACCAQRADFAKFHERLNAHVAVHAARNHRVRFAFGQQFPCGVQRRQRRRACGIGNKIRSAQIQHIRYAPRNNVGQFARHRIFCNRRNAPVNHRVKFVENLRAQIGCERLIRGRRFERVRVFGKHNALCGEIMQLAAHRRTENDARAFGVERALRVTVIFQRLRRDGNCPLLSDIHGVRDARRNFEFFPIELKAAHPRADFAVRLVGRVRVGVKIIGDAPAVIRRFDDAVAFADEIIPKFGRVHRVGHDGADADDGDCFVMRVHLLRVR